MFDYFVRTMPVWATLVCSLITFIGGYMLGRS